MADKSARRPGLCLRFLDMNCFGSTEKQAKEQKHFARDAEATEKKREAKPQPGRRVGGKPNPRQVRGMTLKNVDNKGTEVSSSAG